MTDRDLRAASALERLSGISAAILHLQRTAISVARFPSTVLILGESGTGKELVAQGIHEQSPRHDHPFVTVDCTVLTDTLFESLLFGHERGAFTGATTSTEGLARAANGGTLFLDEVGELSPSGQAKLLRLLQERTVLSVGTTRPVPVDVRFIAATHRDLFAMAASGKFRADLLYRLNVISMRVPPLRDRREDLPVLCDSILNRLVAFLGVRRVLAADAMRVIQSYDWPGNVRELAACLERASVLTEGDEIRPEHLGINPRPLECRLESDELKGWEYRAVTDALRRSGGNKSEAAAALGVDRKTLYRKIERLGIPIRVQLTPAEHSRGCAGERAR